jgi:F-type H+-transporting ATPase subunit epsilon
MLLDIVTPDRRVFTGETDDVVVPGINGELEALPGHAPFVSIVGTGILRYRHGNKDVRLMVSGGFVEIADDRVTLMVESAALVDEVSAEVERKQLHELEQKMKALGPVAAEDEGFLALKAEVDRAATKLTLIK